MNHKPRKFSTVLVVGIFNNSLIILCNFLSLLLLPHNSMSVEDPYYGVCNKTRYCGNVSLSYPFFTHDNDDDPHKKLLCGYPGYHVSCINNQPILKISGDDYVVRNISYANQSLHLISSAFVKPAGCLTLVHNLSLDDGRFHFPTNSATHDLYLLSNCSNGTTPDNYSKLAACPDGRNMYGTYERDRKFQCTVTVKYSGNYDKVADIDQVLKSGLVLQWTATNCSACLESGGQCGYNETLSKFQCYCPDRPHSRRCHDYDGPVPGGILSAQIRLVAYSNAVNEEFGISFSCFKL